MACRAAGGAHGRIALGSGRDRFHEKAAPRKPEGSRTDPPFRPRWVERPGALRGAAQDLSGRIAAGSPGGNEDRRRGRIRVTGFLQNYSSVIGSWGATAQPAWSRAGEVSPSTSRSDPFHRRTRQSFSTTRGPIPGRAVADTLFILTT